MIRAATGFSFVVLARNAAKANKGKVASVSRSLPLAFASIAVCGLPTAIPAASSRLAYFLKQ